MRLLALLAVLVPLGCTAQPGASEPPIPDASHQLVLVVTDAWDATDGTLRRFARTDAGWEAVGEAVAVVVGRSGLGWGRGLHPAGLRGPQKREGDGRAPAGVFALTETFGYADSAATGLPYIASDYTVECVDDAESAFYNRVLSRDSVAVDWTSHEEMRRRDDLYRLGVIVDHNPARVPRAGSCIFLHVWRGPGTSTAGCTAMPSGAMEAVAAWLDAAARPVLVQLPQAEYARRRAAWGLP